MIDGGSATSPSRQRRSSARPRRRRSCSNAAQASVALKGLPGKRFAASKADENRHKGWSKQDKGAATPAAFLAPYYTELDLTGDEQVTQADLDLLAGRPRHDVGRRGLDDVATADFDGDGAIDVDDLAELSQRMIYDDGPFQLVEATSLRHAGRDERRA